MLEHIDLFMPPPSRYEMLQELTRSMAKALERVGVRCRVLYAIRNDPKPFLDSLLSDPPDCTLSFNGLLPDEEGRFLCDMIQIPHVACTVESPQNFISLTQSPLTIVTAMDRFFCDFFSGLNFKRALFMPNGVDVDLVQSPRESSTERQYDVLLAASYIDIDSIKESWKHSYNSSFLTILEETAEVVLSESDTPSYIALAKALDRHVKEFGEFDPKQINFLEVLNQVEDYAKGKARLDLLKAIDKDISIHVVGEGSAHWKHRLGDRKNVTYHESVSYAKVLQMMRNAKIVLNSSVQIKDGIHERILSGIACGAAVMTNENLFMKSNFKNKKTILFNDPVNDDATNGLLRHYLTHHEDREELVVNAQEVVKTEHTWDFRAANLVRDLEDILKGVKIL